MTYEEFSQYISSIVQMFVITNSQLTDGYILYITAPLAIMHSSLAHVDFLTIQRDQTNDWQCGSAPSTPNELVEGHCSERMSQQKKTQTLGPPNKQVKVETTSKPRKVKGAMFLKEKKTWESESLFVVISKPKVFSELNLSILFRYRGTDTLYHVENGKIEMVLSIMCHL